jgi:hypothetical protein
MFFTWLWFFYACLTGERCVNSVKFNSFANLNSFANKTTVQAAVENNARQVATILRGALVRQTRKDAEGRKHKNF